jgi:hypothetical protein
MVNSKNLEADCVGKRILLGQHPGHVPLRRAERYRERGLVQLCMYAQDDLHVGKGNVLFHCHRGRHRSFAGAVAYVMWSVRSVRLEQVQDFICSLHDRCHMREEPTVIKGRERRSLGMELVAWEAFLRRHRPQSVLREIPPKFTPARE